MSKLRKILVGIPVAAIVAGIGLTIDTQPASAFVPASDQCGSYVVAYTWWDDEAFNEWVQRGTTAYYNYARDQSFYYSYLFTSSYC